MPNGDGDHRDAAVQCGNCDDFGMEVRHPKERVKLVDLYCLALHCGHYRCCHCDAFQVSMDTFIWRLGPSKYRRWMPESTGSKQMLDFRFFFYFLLYLKLLKTDEAQYHLTHEQSSVKFLICSSIWQEKSALTKITHSEIPAPEQFKKQPLKEWWG